jgi:hypothetical protein
MVTKPRSYVRWNRLRGISRVLFGIIVLSLSSLFVSLWLLFPPILISSTFPFSLFISLPFLPFSCYLTPNFSLIAVASPNLSPPFVAFAFDLSSTFCYLLSSSVCFFRLIGCRSCNTIDLYSGGGRAIAQAVSRRLPTAAVGVQTRVWSCGILWWTKVALEQVFSENFGFPCQSTFHLLLHHHLHYHPRLAQ